MREIDGRERGPAERGEQPLGHYLREVDRAAVDEIARDYGHLVPPGRIEAMRESPTSFETRDAFDRGLERAHGHAVEPGERVLGYSTGSGASAHVALDHLEIPATVYHERIHQMAEPGARATLGEALDEGITEDLAQRSLGTTELPSAEPCYPDSLMEARRLREACGGQAVESAYFRGDFDELRRCLRESLPEDRWRDLRERIGELP